jgi:hypothetical protein
LRLSLLLLFLGGCLLVGLDLGFGSSPVGALL